MHVCLVPRSQEGSIYQVGGAELWRIAGTGYLSGTPKKASEDWPSEWFYMEDAPLPDLGSQSGSNRDHESRRKVSLRLERHQLAVRD